MPLKLGPISQQIEDMTQEIVDLTSLQEQFLSRAQALLSSISADALRQKLELQHSRQSRFPWLVATPLGSLSSTTSAPRPPSDFSVIGTDASSIPPDRHSSVRYHVLNVGYALLTYGSDPDAVLESNSKFCFRDEDLYLFAEQRDVPIEGVLLGARMEVESLRILQQAVPTPPARPTLALRDGPLILWTLQNESEQVQQALLHGFLGAIAFLQQVGIPLGGYISYSDGRDVANSLRVWLCQANPGACEHCESAERELCLALATIRDRDLFGEGGSAPSARPILAEGQRSGLFSSSSQVLRQYGEHRIDFFYLNTGGEIARVEVPQWVGADKELLGFLHAAIYDQCRRSPGFPPYPPALLEAHEQAVITAEERQLVEELAERAMARRGQSIARSAKDGSKRRRGV